MPIIVSADPVKRRNLAKQLEKLRKRIAGIQVELKALHSAVDNMLIDTALIETEPVRGGDYKKGKKKGKK